MKRTLTVGRPNFPILGWQERVSQLGNPWHQCIVSLALVGDVFEIKKSALPDASDVGLFHWYARTLDDARTGVDGPGGYAATLDAAKAIVECILHNTGTANKSNPPTPMKTTTQHNDKTTATPGPAINLPTQLPEWSVVAHFHEDQHDAYPKAFNVYQNGALMVTAAPDEQAYDALSDLCARANLTPALLDALRELLANRDAAEAYIRDLEGKPEFDSEGNATVCQSPEATKARQLLARL